MNNNIKSPEIRFKGFNEEWKLHKVGEMVTELKDYATYESGLPLLTSSRSGLMYQNEYRGNQSTNNEETLFSVVPYGACTYRHMSDDNIFHLNINSLEKGLVSREYPVFCENSDNILNFLVQYINSSHNFTAFCTEQKKGGTRTRLYFKVLSEFGMLAPSKIEQKKISDYLVALGYLISIQKRDLEKIKNMKKACLQKMFPKEDESIPEIRFKGFTSRWEVKTLGSCFDERLENMPDGELLSVTIGSGIKKFSDLDRHDNSNSDKSKYKKVCIGDIAYNSMRMWQGASGYSEYEGIVSPAYTVVKPKDGIESLFFAYMFKKPDITHIFEINSQGLTSDTWNLKYPTFSKIKVRVPVDVLEQKKIAEYLVEMDKMIDSCERELDLIIKIKKGCLQKMFV